MKELPDRWRELGEFIREQRGMSRLSLRSLSNLAGISNPYLSQIERGLRKPSAEILQQIAKALRISAETLYERAGLLEAHDGNADTATAIMRDPALTEDAKQTLVKVYFSLRTTASGPPAGPPAPPAGPPPPPAGPPPPPAGPPAPPAGPPAARRSASPAASPLPAPPAPPAAAMG